ncbi:MAG: hypothetical protein JNL72_02180 [Flavipsychrobacter sp.]|nr:hypothetical protein [Flavipsychrobacter sp.]
MPAAAQLFARKPVYSGMYFQWGYNRDKYSRSTIRFTDHDYDFTLHNVRASDQPDFKAFRTNPIDITIPQNSVRLGFYLNEAHTHAIELNFDHAKYVMDKYQRAYMTGELGGRQYNGDTVLAPWFVKFEHTNGANFLLLNYVGQHELLRSKKRKLASVVWKAGAGVVVPRSDVRIGLRRTDNRYHIAGYIGGLEGGLRFYPLRNLFMEATAKGGYANYCNVLTVGTGKASHDFWFGEVVGLVGYDFHNAHWYSKKKREAKRRLKVKAS